MNDGDVVSIAVRALESGYWRSVTIAVFGGYIDDRTLRASHIVIRAGTTVWIRAEEISNSDDEFELCIRLGSPTLNGCERALDMERLTLERFGSGPCVISLQFRDMLIERSGGSEVQAVLCALVARSPDGTVLRIEQDELLPMGITVGLEG